MKIVEILDVDLSWPMNKRSCVKAIIPSFAESSYPGEGKKSDRKNSKLIAIKHLEEKIGIRDIRSDAKRIKDAIEEGRSRAYLVKQMMNLIEKIKLEEV